MISNTRCPKCGSSQIAICVAIRSRAEFPTSLIRYGAIIAGSTSKAADLRVTCTGCGRHRAIRGEMFVSEKASIHSERRNWLKGSRP
jgi:hypothetical protein